LAGGVLAPQMPADHVVGHRQQATLEAVRALDPWLLAQAPHPLVGTGRLVACPPCSPALESARVHVFPTAEERTEERDLLVRRRSPRYEQGYRSARHEGQSSRDQVPRNAPRTRCPAGADLGLWSACSAERACCADAIVGENAKTGRFLKTVSSPTPAASTSLRSPAGACRLSSASYGSAGQPTGEGWCRAVAGGGRTRAGRQRRRATSPLLRTRPGSYSRKLTGRLVPRRSWRRKNSSRTPAKAGRFCGVSTALLMQKLPHTGPRTQIGEAVKTVTEGTALAF
jgi:hypothetical protein